MNIRNAPISHMKLDSIQKADYNPRRQLKPGEPAYERIKHSILTYGMVDPLVFNKRTGRLVGGHQRFTILKDLGAESAPVAVVDLSEKEEKDLNIRLNNVHGEFEDESLGLILKELAQEDFDLEKLGFEDSEVQELFTKMEIENEQMGDFLNTMISNEDGDSVHVHEDENGQDRTEDSQNPNAKHTDFKEPEEAQSESYDFEDGGDYFKLTFPVNFNEREIIQQAIKKARSDFKVTTSTEAILRICHQFLGKS